MSHRANYIIINKTEKKFFYNSSGAYGNSIIDLLMKGSKVAIDFIINTTQVTELMTESFMEGCILIDYNEKNVLYWGGDNGLERTINSRNSATKIISEMWENWEVLYASHGIEDIFSYLCLPLPKISPEKTIGGINKLYRDIKISRLNNQSTLTLVKNREYCNFNGLSLDGVLEAGEKEITKIFLENNGRLNSELSVESTHEFRPPEYYHTTILIDYDKRELYYNTFSIFYSQIQKFLENNYWNGWIIQRHNQSINFNIDYIKGLKKNNKNI